MEFCWFHRSLAGLLTEAQSNFDTLVEVGGRMCVKFDWTWLICWSPFKACKMWWKLERILLIGLLPGEIGSWFVNRRACFQAPGSQSLFGGYSRCITKNAAWKSKKLKCRRAYSRRKVFEQGQSWKKFFSRQISQFIRQSATHWASGEPIVDNLDRFAGQSFNCSAQSALLIRQRSSNRNPMSGGDLQSRKIIFFSFDNALRWCFNLQKAVLISWHFQIVHLKNSSAIPLQIANVF